MSGCSSRLATLHAELLRCKRANVCWVVREAVAGCRWLHAAAPPRGVGSELRFGVGLELGLWEKRGGPRERQECLPGDVSNLAPSRPRS